MVGICPQGSKHFYPPDRRMDPVLSLSCEELVEVAGSPDAKLNALLHNDEAPGREFGKLLDRHLADPLWKHLG